jgi:glycine cleavage system H lipoate-binding protein
MSSSDFLQAMAAPAVEKPAAEAPRVNKVSVTEDDVLASLNQMKKDAPAAAAPKEGSMAAMASDATKSPSAMNKAPSSDPFEGL